MDQESKTLASCSAQYGLREPGNVLSWVQLGSQVTSGAGAESHGSPCWAEGKGS